MTKLFLLTFTILSFQLSSFGQQDTILANPTSCEIINFNGEVKGLENEINWAILNGREVDSFILQRTDCHEWKDIALITDIDSSTEVQEFQYFDNNYSLPFVFYRLKTVYKNDSIGYFNTIAINRLAQDEIYVWPNPVSRNLFIQKHKAISLRIQIFDMLGKDVSEMITITENCYHKASLDLSLLAAGMYFVTENGKSHRFIKQ